MLFLRDRLVQRESRAPVTLNAEDQEHVLPFNHIPHGGSAMIGLLTPANDLEEEV